MTSSAALLTAMRLSDSMLPIGTYTASYGVEQYLNESEIETADELGELLAGYLRGVIGPAEIVALGHAHRSAAAGDIEGIVAADERLGAATLPAEFRDSSTKAGRKLLELLAETEGEPVDDTGEGVATDADPLAGAAGDGTVAEFAAACEDGRADGHYPVVLGIVCQRAGLSAREAALANAYGSVSGLLAAAQRLGRFGHTAIQSQLSALFPVIEEVSDRYHDAELDAMCSFAPLADVMGMAHERADRRLFMS
ncbi:urease accessory protein UreF [Halorubrum saccharovorum]|uniref:Urease accessory protein UreF n=1 Tax=Halorubrum saccharovorum TaxID=2248 RepID=A0A0F8CL66_9EURY|nr:MULTISPECIES: urease accessory UreF family protein [Halorubrum]KKF39647.1 urease accessory protein UreF [Halorubrum saccharovorum]